MKRTGKILFTSLFFGTLLNNFAYATTEVVEDESGLPTKYIFIGIAALVILLLLYLGYRMDTKGNDTSSKFSNSQQIEKTKKKLEEKVEEINKNADVYEEDKFIYEPDNEEFNNEDLNENIEYKEDDEESLYSSLDEDEEENYDDEIEEFDTTFIDELEENSKQPFDETMIFTNSNGTSTEEKLEDEIDSLENIEEDNNLLLEEKENDEDFINKLKSYEKPESNLAGFSVATNDKKKDEVKSTKSAKDNDDIEVNPAEKKVESTFVDNDFLSQMEANLQKNQEDRKNKKNK